MASDKQEHGAVSAAAGSGKVKDTMSQFVARILEQLSLSAWLPSAALILIVAFIFQLGTELDVTARPHDPAKALGAAISAMASVNLGGAALFVVGVIVLTMITQAFEFEAIRALEGYWGTNPLVERVARRCCAHYRRQKRKLEKSRRRYRRKAWNGARRRIERIQQQLEAQGRPRQLTPDMVKRMGAQALGSDLQIELTPEQNSTLASIEWEPLAPPEPMRRVLNIDKRLRYIPESHRVMPMRLGNVLRSCEDEVGRTRIEPYIQEVFDDLPLSLRAEHDEHRGRLQLYCSMVFVLVFTIAVAVGRFVGQHIFWCIAACAFLAMCIWLMYRAAIASAQAYGALLVTIRDWSDDHPSSSHGTLAGADVSTGA